jgi:hypothetical protein
MPREKPGAIGEQRSPAPSEQSQGHQDGDGDGDALVVTDAASYLCPTL